MCPATRVNPALPAQVRKEKAGRQRSKSSQSPRGRQHNDTTSRGSMFLALINPKQFCFRLLLLLFTPHIRTFPRFFSCIPPSSSSLSQQERSAISLQFVRFCLFVTYSSFFMARRSCTTLLSSSHIAAPSGLWWRLPRAKMRGKLVFGDSGRRELAGEWLEGWKVWSSLLLLPPVTFH